MNLTGLRTVENAGEGKVSSPAYSRLAFATALWLSCQVFFPAVASAATGNVVFSGSITTANQCTITVVNDGTFGLRADRMQLSSKLAGGAAAVADIRSNHAYNISAIAVPTLTSYPVGGDTGVTMQSLYSGASILNGATFAEQNGNVPVTLRNGLSRTRLTVNLIATRTGSPYPVGYYQGTVTVRCE